jgi:hypothetical protein
MGRYPHLTAADVRRGTSRWLLRAGVAPLAEVSLGNGRRADLFGVDAAGRITIVEIKVSLGDLRGDRKWPDYLDHCDRFFWAVPLGFPLDDLHGEVFRPEATGLIVADAHDAEALRDAPWQPMHVSRRKAELLRMARAAALRVALLADPEAAVMDFD